MRSNSTPLSSVRSSVIATTIQLTFLFLPLFSTEILEITTDNLTASSSIFQILFKGPFVPQKIAVISIHGVGAPRPTQTASHLIQRLSPRAQQKELALPFDTLPFVPASAEMDEVFSSAQTRDFAPSNAEKEYITYQFSASEVSGKDIDLFELYWGDLSTKHHPLKTIFYSITFVFRILCLGCVAADTASPSLSQRRIWRIYIFLLRMAGHCMVIGGLFCTALLLVVATARGPLQLRPSWQRPIGSLGAAVVAAAIIYLGTPWLTGRVLRWTLASLSAAAAWITCNRTFIHAIPDPCTSPHLPSWSSRLAPQHLLAFDWVFGWSTIVLLVGLWLAKVVYRSPLSSQRLWLKIAKAVMLGLAAATPLYFVSCVQTHYGDHDCPHTHVIRSFGDAISSIDLGRALPLGSEMDPSGIGGAVLDGISLISGDWGMAGWMLPIALFLCAMPLALIGIFLFPRALRPSALGTIWTLQFSVSVMFAITEWVLAASSHVIASFRGSALFDIPKPSISQGLVTELDKVLFYAGLPAACYIFLLSLLAITVCTLLPSIVFELRPATKTDAGVERWGRWLTRGLGLLRSSLYLSLPLIVMLQFPLLIAPGWMGTLVAAMNANVWRVLGTAGFGFLFILLLVIGGVMRPILGIARDVEIYLRTTPPNYTPKAGIFRRFFALTQHLEKEGCYSRIVFVCHSQGTVITTDFLRFLHRAGCRFSCPTSLITFGSPLRQLYSFAFPSLYDWLDDQELHVSLGIEKWTNLYCSSDYIGRSLWRQDHDGAYRMDPFQRDALEERCLGLGAHTHYWSHPQVISTIMEHLSR